MWVFLWSQSLRHSSRAGQVGLAWDAPLNSRLLCGLRSLSHSLSGLEVLRWTLLFCVLTLSWMFIPPYLSCGVGALSAAI